MSNLENLVPPLELCRKIPDGCFSDSALVWWNKAEPSVYPREDVPSLVIQGGYCSPAPTLQEILDALARMELCPGLNVILPANGKVIYTMHAGVYIFSQGDNPSAAALKLWLEVNKSVKSKEE